MAAREAWESGNDLLRMESGRAVAGSIVTARTRYATPGRGVGRRGHSLAGANISPSLSLPPVDVPPSTSEDILTENVWSAVFVD